MSNIIERYKNKMLANRLKVPYTIEELWLAGCYAFKNKEAGRAVITPYFQNHQYVEYDEGDIVPVFRLKTGIVFYRILRWKKYPGSDPAIFDDKKEYDMVFHHFEAKL